MLCLPPLSLYIHIPWCQRKCPYCDFNSHQASREIPESAYVASLLQDLERDLCHVAGRPLQSIFIGGGTPSLFSAAAIETLLCGIRERLALAPDCEITLEANPGSAEAEKFSGFLAAGVNRISLGVQSLDNRLLQALGRVHSADEALAAIRLLASLPLQSFNLDLMHGLPDQTQTQARHDLRQALAAEPPHLSWYQLTIEPNTVYYTNPPALPTEKLLGDIQDRGEAQLARAGLQQYEVSAYARPGHQCRHNRNYWEFGDYLGIGAGAHGKVTLCNDHRIIRYSKTRLPADYLSRGNADFLAAKHDLTERQLAGEFMMNALRLNRGFNPASFASRTGIPLGRIEKTLERLINREMLEYRPDCLRPTPLGRRYLDTVVGEFL